MKTTIGRTVPHFVALTVLLLLLQIESPIYGQAPRRAVGRRYPSALSEPIISPYLNLTRPDADAGFNYFTLVQPQLQQMRNFQAQSAQIQQMNTDLFQLKAMPTPYGNVGGIRPTGGRAATFRNYSHYYPALGQGASGGRPARNYPSSASGGGMGGMGMGGFGFGGGF